MDIFLENTMISAIVMITMGFVALRLAGRKSLSQMTISQAVIMIAVGSILVEPVKDDHMEITILSIFLFVIVLIVLEYLSLVFPIFEGFLVGKSKVVIDNGKINHKNLKKLRMTKNQLDMVLRQNGIGNVSDVKIATLEANGTLGYEMKPQANAITIRDFEVLTGGFFKQYRSQMTVFDKKPDELFEEVLEQSEEFEKGAE